MLIGTVGIKEFAADIYYLLAVPVHNKAGLILNNGNGAGLKVFAVGQL